MNTKQFKQLHSDAVGLGEIGNKINVTIGNMFRNKADRSSYLEWLTATARDDSQGSIVAKQVATEVKAVQKNVNLTNTQKLMLTGKVGKEALTEKVRLVRANKPLMAQGKVTQSDIDNKQYFFIVTDIVPTTHTLESDLEALMKKWGAGENDIVKALKK